MKHIVHSCTNSPTFGRIFCFHPQWRIISWMAVSCVQNAHSLQITAPTKWRQTLQNARVWTPSEISLFSLVKCNGQASCFTRLDGVTLRTSVPFWKWTNWTDNSLTTKNNTTMIIQDMQQTYLKRNQDGSGWSKGGYLRNKTFEIEAQFTISGKFRNGTSSDECECRSE